MNHTNLTVPNIDDFEASTCGVKNRTSGTGGMSIVSSPNVKRLTLNALILENVSNQESIQIAYSDEIIAISHYFGATHTDYLLKIKGTSGVIYNSALVNEIVNRYELDFSSRTSMTFPIIKVEEIENEKIVFIKMKTEKE